VDGVLRAMLFGQLPAAGNGGLLDAMARQHDAVRLVNPTRARRVTVLLMPLMSVDMMSSPFI
jgi:hypothetical protein